MRYMLPALILVAAVLCCFGCTPAASDAQIETGAVMPIARMETDVTDQYAAIAWDGRYYVPFCPIDASVCGRQIGIVDGDDQEKVYEFKEHSVNEWIVSAHPPHDEAMLYRELQVRTIPDGLTSEYDWNNQGV